jgi:hypothetical protein
MNTKKYISGDATPTKIHSALLFPDACLECIRLVWENPYLSHLTALKVS